MYCTPKIKPGRLQGQHGPQLNCRHTQGKHRLIHRNNASKTWLRILAKGTIIIWRLAPGVAMERSYRAEPRQWHEKRGTAGRWSFASETWNVSLDCYHYHHVESSRRIEPLFEIQTEGYVDLYKSIAILRSEIISSLVTRQVERLGNP